MEVSDVGKLMRGVLRCGRALHLFRGMQSQLEWLREYIEMLEKIDNTEPQIFDSLAFAIASLLLMHHNSGHDWIRKKSRNARRKTKKAKKKNKKTNNDDDNDGDGENGGDGDAGPGDDEDDVGISEQQQNEMDEAIDASVNEPLINCDSANAVPVERFLDDYKLFIPYIEPLIFEAPAKQKRPHRGINYSLLMVLQTCVAVADTFVLIGKCRKKLLALRTELYERLGFVSADECKCRILVLGWGETYSTPKSRGYRAIKKQIGASNKTTSDGITCEFFSIEEMQHDITKGETDQFVVVEDADLTPSERKWLRTVKVHEMRRLIVSEPQAALRDFVVGQRVRVKRSHIHSGGQTFEYLQVVDG